MHPRSRPLCRIARVAERGRLVDHDPERIEITSLVAYLNSDREVTAR
jgi:hypothetical protein